MLLGVSKGPLQERPLQFQHRNVRVKSWQLVSNSSSPENPPKIQKHPQKHIVYTNFLESSCELFPTSLWHESGTQQKSFRKTCSDEQFYFGWILGGGFSSSSLGPLIVSRILYVLLVGEKQYIASARFCTQSCSIVGQLLVNPSPTSHPMRSCKGLPCNGPLATHLIIRKTIP